jgi:protein SCO1/2
MRTSVKAGLLILLLVIPALTFIFLKNFGKNHYSLPRYIPRIDSTTGDVLMQTRVVEGKTITDTVYHTIPDFSLIDQHNDKVSRTLIEGKVHVADFFFARCPGICPKMSSQLQRVQEAFINNPDVVILSYSVDPKHDSVQALQNYAEQYGAIKGKWFLLTGEKNEIYNLAKNGYFISAMEGNVKSNDLEENFVHTDKFILIDKLGQIRGYYNGTDPADVDRLIVEMKVLLEEYKNQSAT